MLNHIKLKLIEYSEEENIPLSESKILLSISGGVDSMVMADVFHNVQADLKFKLSLAHVNHKYRHDADECEDFCREYAAIRNYEFYSTQLNADKISGSFEHWARKERYRFLKITAETTGCHWIITGHHQDDQLETIFMKRKQKSSWISLIGIRERFGKIRRPFLQISKKMLVKYARQNDVNWIDDYTNEDISFFRNNIRHHLLPAAMKNDPSLKVKLLNSSKKAREKLTELTGQLDRIQQRIVIKKNERRKFFILDKSQLLTIPNDLKILFIHSIIEQIISDDNISLTAAHWRSFWRFITNSATGMIFDISKNIFCLYDRDKLVFYSNESIENSTKRIVNNENISWNDGIFETKEISKPQKFDDKNIFLVNFNLIKNGLFVRGWQNGDKICSFNNGKIIKLSDLFINNKLSRFEKMMQPVVFNQKNKICWIPGLIHGKLAENELGQNTKLMKIKWTQQ